MTHLVIPATSTVEAHVIDAGIALLPVGSFEQHGPHLPLATDTLVAVAIANTIAAAHPVLQLPPVTISCSHEHAAFAGTVSISATTLGAIVTDIAESLRYQSVAGLLVINAHGGNYVLANVVQQANLAGPARIGLYPTRDDWHEARRASGMTSDPHDDMHAGELETSILLAAFPDFVRDGWEHADLTFSDRRHLPTLGIAAYTKTGVIGCPSHATAAKGREALQRLAEGAQKIIRIIEDAPGDG